jgi:protein-disulfide isomerase/uncharacterized membrane protein
VEERRSFEILARLAALVALTISILLLRDYLAAAPMLCGAGGGCDVVRHSVYAHLLGVPTPAFGVAFYATVLLLLCLPSQGARQLVRLLVIPGAIASAAFLVLQFFVIHAICKYCFVTDVIGIGLLPLTLIVREPRQDQMWKPFIAGAIIAAAIPFAIGGKAAPAATKATAGGKYQETLPPPVAAAEPAGTATIVEFIDFECPYCRKEAASLRRLLKTRPNVKIVRKMTPLPPDMHPHATDAALAWCCAEEAGKGDEMADLLMTTDPDDLTPGHCQKLAEKLGVDPGFYTQCLASGRPAARLAADATDAQAADVPGLPTFWVGHMRFIGAQPDELVASAVDQAIAASSAQPQ